ncbi:MAG TPA: hypothetical protein V6C69_05030 [Trichormus sp.]|jgi:hypothetical protein
MHKLKLGLEADYLNKFMTTTVDRHGSKRSRSAQNPLVMPFPGDVSSVTVLGD